MDDTTTIAGAATSISGNDEQPLVFLHGICRQFRQGDATLDVLRGAELAVWAGQSVALVGPSGAGKSTLLHIAGLLEHADAGEVYIDADADLPPVRYGARPVSGALKSASSISSIICCRNFRRWRTSSCRK